MNNQIMQYVIGRVVQTYTLPNGMAKVVVLANGTSFLIDGRSQIGKAINEGTHLALLARVLLDSDVASLIVFQSPGPDITGLLTKNAITNWGKAQEPSAVTNFDTVIREIQTPTAAVPFHVFTCENSFVFRIHQDEQDSDRRAAISAYKAGTKLYILGLPGQDIQVYTFEIPLGIKISKELLGPALILAQVTA